MGKNAILIYQLGISGSLINSLDYAEFLQKNYNFKIIQNYKFNLKNLLSKTRRHYDVFVYDIVNSFYEVYDNFIVDVNYFFYYKYIKWKNNKKQISKQCYIFDTLELFLYLNNIQTVFFNKNRDNFNLKNVIKEHCLSSKFIILTTPFYYEQVKDYFKDDKQFEVRPYLKKINVPVLNTIQFKSNGKKFSREYISDGIDVITDFNKVNAFDYDTYVYKRRKYIAYTEIVGRLIFEFILLGKQVEFAEDIYKKHDGLIDYINYYGLEKDKMKNKINIYNYNLETLFKE